MKYKTLSILLLFILLITGCNMSFATINVNNSGVSVTLQDIDLSASAYLMTYNTSSNTAELIVAPEGSTIYYDLGSKTFYCADSTYTKTSFNYYSCIVVDNVGREWSTVTTKSSFTYADSMLKVKQAGTIYPYHKGSNSFIDILPEGVTWEDSFYISTSNGHIIMVLATSDGVWVNDKGNGVTNRFRPTYDSTENLTMLKYVFSNHSWRADGTDTGTHGYFTEAIYYSDDIINKDGTVFVSGMRSFFQPPPVTETEQTPTTLAEIMKTAGEQATAKMGQIILIVIMTTAGLTVLLIGLKKGLTVLMNGLRH